MTSKPEVTGAPQRTKDGKSLAYSSSVGSDSGASSGATNSTTSAVANAGTTDAAARASLEAARREKLGALVVQLGGASEEKVFGSTNSAAMLAYREQRVPDLLVINRREDDAAAHPFVWYNPITWFTSGPQVSPLRWSSGPAVGGESIGGGLHAAGNTTTNRVTATSTGSGADAVAAQTDGGGALNQTIAAPVGTLLLKAAGAATAERKKKRNGLPPVVLNPLTEDEVQHKLTDQVRTDREKLLKSEERIHKVLQGIEDTRYKYLVPRQDLPCERQVHDVVACYQKQNAAAEKKRLAMTEKRRQELAKGYSNQVNDEDMDVPIVLFNALACGVKVDAMKACTAKMVSAYSSGTLD